MRSFGGLQDVALGGWGCVMGFLRVVNREGSVLFDIMMLLFFGRKGKLMVFHVMGLAKRQ